VDGDRLSPYQYTRDRLGLGTASSIRAQTTGKSAHGQGYSLTAPAGNAIVDGQSLQSATGVKTSTFEFDFEQHAE